MPPLPQKKVDYADRKEKLAISLADLDNIRPEIRGPLLAGKINLSEIVPVGTDRVEDIAAVVFTCDLLTAALVCDYIRSENRKHNDKPAQIYINKDSSWSRITNGTLLTTLVGGKAKLNPQIFPGEVLDDGSAPEVKPLRIGRY